MTKDELEKEAEEKYDTKYGKRCENLWNGAIFSLGYLAGAEPREKRIEQLEQENVDLRARLQKKINTTTVSDYPYSALKLEEAKEIIALSLRVCETSSIEYMNWYQKRAEQFINDLEK